MLHLIISNYGFYINVNRRVANHWNSFNCKNKFIQNGFYRTEKLTGPS